MMTSRPPQPFHFALVVLILLALMLLWPGMVPAATTAAARKAAPDFSLDGPDGTPVKLSSYRGKIVLLDFWATWCHGCKTEIPWYVEFQDKYKSQGLAAIGVSMDDDGWKAVKPFLAEHKLNYPIVIGSEPLAKQYAVESLPVTLLIDRRGNIAESHAGLVDKSAFEADIQTLLKEK